MWVTIIAACSISLIGAANDTPPLVTDLPVDRAMTLVDEISEYRTDRLVAMLAEKGPDTKTLKQAVESAAATGGLKAVSEGYPFAALRVLRKRSETDAELAAYVVRKYWRVLVYDYREWFAAQLRGMDLQQAVADDIAHFSDKDNYWQESSGGVLLYALAGADLRGCKPILQALSALESNPNTDAEMRYRAEALLAGAGWNRTEMVKALRAPLVSPEMWNDRESDFGFLGRAMVGSLRDAFPAVASPEELWKLASAPEASPSGKWALVAFSLGDSLDPPEVFQYTGLPMLKGVWRLIDPALDAPGHSFETDRKRVLNRVISYHSRRDWQSFAFMGDSWKTEKNWELRLEEFLLLVVSRASEVSLTDYEHLVAEGTEDERRRHQTLINCTKAFLGDEEALKEFLKEVKMLRPLNEARGTLIELELDRETADLVRGTDFSSGRMGALALSAWALDHVDELQYDSKGRFWHMK